MIFGRVVFIVLAYDGWVVIRKEQVVYFGRLIGHSKVLEQEFVHLKKRPQESHASTYHGKSLDVRFIPQSSFVALEGAFLVSFVFSCDTISLPLHDLLSAPAAASVPQTGIHTMFPPVIFSIEYHKEKHKGGGGCSQKHKGTHILMGGRAGVVVPTIMDTVDSS